MANEANLVKFAPGPDPRRGNGLTPEVRKARELLNTHVEAGVAKLLELMASGDEKIQLAAAVEILDRTMGKPKHMDGQTVEDRLREIFGALRENISEANYVALLESMAGSQKR